MKDFAKIKAVTVGDGFHDVRLESDKYDTWLAEGSLGKAGKN